MAEHLSLGLIIYASVKPIIKIYFIIGLGFYLAKKNILTVTTCRDISNAVVTAIMPCLIFNKIITNLKSSDIKDIGILFFTGTVLIMTGGLLGYLTSVVTKSPKRWLGGLISVGLFPNISDLPIAYLQTLSNGGLVITTDQGNKGVAYVCIFLASQVLYQFSCGLYKLIQWDFRESLIPDDEETQVESKNIPDTLPVLSDENTSITSSCLSATAEDLKHTAKFPENSQHDQFLLAREQSETLQRNDSIQSCPSSLNLHRTRSADLRKQKSQDIRDVINEYSEFHRMKSHEPTTSGFINASAAPVFPNIDDEDEEEDEDDDAQQDLSNSAASSTSKKTTTKKKFKFKKYLIELGKNFLSPNSVALILSLAIAMAPPLRSLFVQSSFYIPTAPDKQPPLSFIMDTASYVGAASVPLGLMLLGATISRLQVKEMPPGFWKTAAMITGCRLVILPMIGVGLSTGLHKAGWYDDIIIRFVSVLQFGLPSATALVYFTAFYTDPMAEKHLQMDCLAVCLIAQYSLLWFTLPFLVTFSFKVSIGL